MRIYQAADERWILWTDSEKIFFNTQAEAIRAMDKLKLAQAVVYQTQLHIKAMDEGPDVLQEYFDSGVTFVDADVEALGITAADVVNCLTMLENAGKFYAGNTPTNAVYRSTVNAVRRVDVS